MSVVERSLTQRKNPDRLFIHIGEEEKSLKSTECQKLMKRTLHNDQADTEENTHTHTHTHTQVKKKKKKHPEREETCTRETARTQEVTEL